MPGSPGGLLLGQLDLPQGNRGTTERAGLGGTCLGLPNSFSRVSSLPLLPEDMPGVLPGLPASILQHPPVGFYFLLVRFCLFPPHTPRPVAHPEPLVSGWADSAP